MDFVRRWVLSVCLTVIIAVIFSFLTPKGNMGRFYKIMVSLFVFLSFFYPLKSADFTGFDVGYFGSETSVQNNECLVYETMICKNVEDVLENNGVTGAAVDCNIHINDQNEVSIDDVQVAISSDYDVNRVKSLIYNELNINAGVIYNGQ